MRMVGKIWEKVCQGKLFSANLTFWTVPVLVELGMNVYTVKCDMVTTTWVGFCGALRVVALLIIMLFMHD